MNSQIRLTQPKRTSKIEGLDECHINRPPLIKIEGLDEWRPIDVAFIVLVTAISFMFGYCFFNLIARLSGRTS